MESMGLHSMHALTVRMKLTDAPGVSYAYPAESFAAVSSSSSFWELLDRRLTTEVERIIMIMNPTIVLDID